jgi:hypothetical protein
VTCSILIGPDTKQWQIPSMQVKSCHNNSS